MYAGFPTAAILLLGGALSEWPHIRRDTAAGGGLHLAAAHAGVFAAAPLVSAAVNVSSFLAINATSSLTFKVAGCIKNVAVVA